MGILHRDSSRGFLADFPRNPAQPISSSSPSMAVKSASTFGICRNSFPSQMQLKSNSHFITCLLLLGKMRRGEGGGMNWV